MSNKLALLISSLGIQWYTTSEEDEAKKYQKTHLMFCISGYSENEHVTIKKWILSKDDCHIKRQSRCDDFYMIIGSFEEFCFSVKIKHSLVEEFQEMMNNIRSQRSCVFLFEGELQYFEKKMLQSFSHHVIYGSKASVLTTEILDDQTLSYISNAITAFKTEETSV